MKYRPMMKTLLIAALLITTFGSSCSSNPPAQVISQDRQVRRLKANVPFTPPYDGWFEPDAVWQEEQNIIESKLR